MIKSKDSPSVEQVCLHLAQVDHIPQGTSHPGTQHPDLIQAFKNLLK